ncbi:alpha/beta hydrolase [Cerasicoccus arenae]|uniref:BD-FAE-like domain-containing protein n=1 Tax=Cerasicoccus arenae TaxID=424488 RepID=A0A8J3DB16_9BACT|nr:alpha/beta hydrolase [Cerasicoccus arenae]MBK1856772.1 alpha/beta hydrolase [Cerasicoccus arenae]GHB99405.1 hypothetical protein GCM10007047_14550 [Cerasicoccus arenae]
MPAVLFDETVRLESDIDYLGAERTEKLDAYLPPKNFLGPAPAVLLIHGGGWRILDKAMERERNIGYVLAAQGFAVFSINYKLNEVIRDPNTNEITSEVAAWPQNLYDCKSALRFMRKEAVRFNIDPDRIATMGGSAGGHLAMMLGATTQVDEMNKGGLYLDQSNAVSCILNFYGPHVIRDRKISPFGGETPEETEANQIAASPATYINENFPPIFIAHGSADKIVGVEYSRELAALLAEKGLRYWYFEIGGAPHTFHLQPEHMDLRPLVLTFLREQLGEPVKAG